MLHVVDEVLDTAIKILEKPSIKDDELGLFLELLYIVFLIDTEKDVDWHGVEGLFEEAISTASPKDLMDVADKINEAKVFPKYPDRSKTTDRYHKIKKYWQAIRPMFDEELSNNPQQLVSP